MHNHFDPYRNDPHHRHGVPNPYEVRDHDPLAPFHGKCHGIGDGTHFAFIGAVAPIFTLLLVGYVIHKGGVAEAFFHILCLLK